MIRNPGVNAPVVMSALGRAGSGPLRSWMRANQLRVAGTVKRAAAKTKTTRSLTIFRMGLGRDSLAMLGLLLEGKLTAGGAPLTPEDVDAVVFTDPGAEWQGTYALIPKVARLCEQHGLRFIVQAKPPAEGTTGWREWVKTRPIGSREEAPWRRTRTTAETVEERAARGYYHPRAPIMADYASKGTVVAYNDASCTVNHKIGPNRGLINDLAQERFGLDNRAWSAAVRKGARPPHRVLLGIAADETERLVECPGPAYEKTFYPLAEAGVTKDTEGPILARYGFENVHKSGCVMCKFQPIEWYWALRETDPAKFAEVVAFEANALRTSPNLLLFPKGVPPSNGWNGDPRPAKERERLTLDAAVRLWRDLNPHATIDAVLSKAYKMCDGKPSPKPNPQTCRSARAALRQDAAQLVDVLATIHG